MVAADNGHASVVKWLARHGANIRSSAQYGTTADVAAKSNPKLSKWLEDRSECANEGCEKAGSQKCGACEEVRYCGRQCQKAHWLAEHKRECKYYKL